MSDDGVHFRSLYPHCLTSSYLRAWLWEGMWYGMTSEGGQKASSRLYRSADGVTDLELQHRHPFEGASNDYIRHVALLRGSGLKVAPWQSCVVVPLVVLGHL